jgi:hypothetical protein
MLNNAEPPRLRTSAPGGAKILFAALSNKP